MRGRARASLKDTVTGSSLAGKKKNSSMGEPRKAKQQNVTCVFKTVALSSFPLLSSVASIGLLLLQDIFLMWSDRMQGRRRELSECVAL
jgi:hypothetical protein